MRPDAGTGQVTIAQPKLKPEPLAGVLPRAGAAAVQQIDTVSTDVFDTLLLRRPVSERQRIVDGERRFAACLAHEGYAIDADIVVDTRLTVQRLAFRALNVGAVAGNAIQGAGEVRLRDIVSRQLRLVGVPQAFVGDRIAIELEVERESLRPNRRLARFLACQRAAGRRVVAISDTTLDTAALEALIGHFSRPA